MPDYSSGSLYDKTAVAQELFRTLQSLKNLCSVMSFIRQIRAVQQDSTEHIALYKLFVIHPSPTLLKRDLFKCIFKRVILTRLENVRGYQVHLTAGSFCLTDQRPFERTHTAFAEAFTKMTPLQGFP